MNQINPSLQEVILKTVVVHTVSYFLMGILAFSLLDYEQLYAETSLDLFMRQVSEPLVMAGPLFQPLRGILFGVVFYLLGDVIFRKTKGWLTGWLTLVILGIVSTFGPSPGSIEGMVYTILPLRLHFIGLPETVLQSFLLIGGLTYWLRHPEKKWMNWVLGIAFLIVMALPALGLFYGA